jgi:hypothetical protein
VSRFQTNHVGTREKAESKVLMKTFLRMFSVLFLFFIDTQPCCVQLLFTKDQLKQMGDPAKGRPMIAIMGEVYDVSAAPQYYGELPAHAFSARLFLRV